MPATPDPLIRLITKWSQMNSPIRRNSLNYFTETGNSHTSWCFGRRLSNRSTRTGTLSNSFNSLYSPSFKHMFEANWHKWKNCNEFKQNRSWTVPLHNRTQTQRAPTQPRRWQNNQEEQAVKFDQRIFLFFKGADQRCNLAFPLWKGIFGD